MIVSGENADRGVADLGVNECYRADSLSKSATRGHIQTDCAIVNVDALIRPTPIPDLIDGSLTTREGEVSDSKLLIAPLKVKDISISRCPKREEAVGN